MGAEGPGASVKPFSVEPGTDAVGPFFLLPGVLLLDAVKGDVAGAVHGDGQSGGALGQFRVIDAYVRGRAAADVVPADAQPVDGPGGGTAGHPEFHDTGRLTGNAAGRIVQADDNALAQR